tara:strand:- start:59 stop:730 length:672 start_codon:yes stop_codon:yes gene_type:complete
MAKKAVIYDNDGILVDSEIIYAKANQKAISKLYKKANIEDILDITVGKSEKESRENLTNKYGVLFNKEFLDLKKSIVDDEMLNNLKPCFGVIILMKSTELKIALASNAYRHEIDFKLKHTGLNKYFTKSQIFSGEEVANPKPAPDVYLAAAAGINEKPEDCIAVEDSASGVKAGKAAGMYTVGCLGGSHIFNKQEHRQKLIDAGADIVINDMSELKQVIEELM